MLHWPMQNKRIFNKGNTFVEYALIGLLLTILCIAAMQLVGSSFNLAMAKIRDDIVSHKQSAVAALLNQGAQLTGYNTTLTQSQLQQLQLSLPNKLQTTGANGSTDILANQIAATAALLLSEGKIDQARYDILMKLSNQGHRMAQIESMVADAVRLANGNANTFATLTFNFEGQSYTATELANMVGSFFINPDGLSSENILTTTQGQPQAELVKFLDLYQQAVGSGALSDPVIKATIDSASTQIAMLGELTENAVYEVNQGNISPDSSSLTASQASSSTAMESSQICTTGNFQDNGILCTP